MANAVLMPKAGITVESCIIGKWEKKVGDQIAEGDILFTYETDKAAFECESTAAGELLEIFFGDGEEVPCLVNVCHRHQGGGRVRPAARRRGPCRRPRRGDNRRPCRRRSCGCSGR